MKDLPPHPTQPIVRDAQGELRFHENAVVRCLFERDGGDLESLKKLGAPPEDYVQLAQLLGCAVADRCFDAIRSTLASHVVKKKLRVPQPMQPVHEDDRGTIRFRRNAVVDELVDRDDERGRVYPDFPARTDGGLNWVAMQDFTREDQAQLAQLVGYSVSGYHELDYVSNKSAAQASRLAAEIFPDAGAATPSGDSRATEALDTTFRAVKIKDSATAGLVRCGTCDRGFRRVEGIHIGSQRLGMIPDVPCDRVFASHGGSMTEDSARPWMAYVDGDPIRKKSGDARRFATAKAAYAAACKAAPKRWHP